jgi:dihydrofolate reductase
MIYASDLEGCIGNGLDLPWTHLEADMKWFVQNTRNKIVVMGSTTWDSIPKKLPGRINVVISSRSSDDFDKTPDLIVAGDPWDVLQDIKTKFPDQDIIIIGGRSIYIQFLEYVERIHVTLIQDIYDGDTYFSCRGLMQAAYKLEHQAKLPGCDNTPDLLFETYVRPIQ